MRASLKTLIIASTLVAGIAAAPVLYSHETEDTAGSGIAPMDQGGMMGQGHMTDQGDRKGQDGTMGHDDMMGMKNTTDLKNQMNQMMEAHIKMMQTMLDAHGAAPSDNN